MQPQAFFDSTTGTISYVVHDGRVCAIIDPVLDYDPKSGRTSTAGADAIMAFIQTQGLQCQWILETHAHADHLSAARYLQHHMGGKLAIGRSIQQVQAAFKPIFNLDLPADGSQFDHLFQPDETFAIGSLQARALHVPGHTPADMAYQIGDAVFVGDTLFMPDVGTARCDFPGGDAALLYRSIRRLLALPPATRLFMCHDYPPDGRVAAWETTVAAQRATNIHVHDGVAEADFVAMRQKRDATLPMPTLILPAIQVNIRAGALPDPDDNGTRYLKIPLNRL
ncbi:MBL fold metallo-hydrolase [Bordetella holmesii]|uniref:Metallo-beta-lactamase domain protein n=2 Tax=Bordetella holmesii TaxID=35814 RepID=A0A158M8T7_9BORD|nr:MBL fold metallo-hydrolase [Bordetella holmesii]AHV93766.1 metallo-beta-lactamase superfamily protein [Bordetella holmesii ATCC 51541]AIT25892.1 metallo-beta-lactamase superfamily protein [Bordetella holmesii 44057]EWM43069.1 metallo-beta-lactamase superfamily protein [Bordetella holmesii 41130]EWM46461.1 metallo-beta-lactamase superfamily protein [Bordetella holmesii 35009]EWM50626.1 metallo-beta-lactamase superfamily protein [Bordetella holmesii 70147]